MNILSHVIKFLGRVFNRENIQVEFFFTKWDLAKAAY